MAMRSFVLLFSRVLIALLFLHEGAAKLGNLAGAENYAALSGLPAASVYPAIALEIGCGVLLVIGLWTRSAAFLLAIFCVVTALLFHMRFSNVNQLLHFEKNLAIAGGLFALIIAGPGPWSFERRGGTEQDS